MKHIRLALTAGLLIGAVGAGAPAHASEDLPKRTQAAADATGLHDFDFQVGEWRVHHRVKRPADRDQWLGNELDHGIPASFLGRNREAHHSTHGSRRESQVPRLFAPEHPRCHIG